MDILDDMGVSKLSAKVFFKVNYSFKCEIPNLSFNWLFLHECSHVFFSTQRRVSLHHRWPVVRFMTGNQSSHSPPVTTSMRTTANTRNFIILSNKPKKRSDSFIIGYTR